MFNRQQFSLRYLLVEIFLVASALGFFRAAFVIQNGLGALFFLAGIAVSGAAIGGLFGNFGLGTFWTVVAVMLIWVLLILVGAFF
jgi:hypothetical protein